MKPFIRRSICVMMILFCCANMFATDYLVYSVIGDVHFAEKKEKTVHPRSKLSSKDYIYIGSESALFLLEGKRMYCFSYTEPTTSTIDELISSTKNSVFKLIKRYVRYMVNSLYSDESYIFSHPDAYMQSATTSYRSMKADSLLMNRLAQITSQQPTSEESSMETRLTDKATFIDSDFDVSFQLISSESGQPIGRDVNIGTSCYVRVINNSQHLLYVNVLNIDAQGEKYLVLPVDSAASCRHLMVPPTSTISFKSEPFEFVDNGQTETFILIATEEPVDFSILMSPIINGNGKALRAGVFRMQYQTH